MSRRETQVNVSPDLEQERQERDALLGEKNNLQSEMIELGKTNKRLKIEIETLKEERELTGKQYDALREAVKGHVALKESVEQEIESLDKEYADKKARLELSLPDVKKALANLERQKQPIQSEINKLLLDKKELQKNLEEISNEVYDKNNILAGINLSIELGKKQDLELKESIKENNLELEKLIEQVSKNETIVSEIEKRQVILSDINKQISDNDSSFILKRNEQKQILETENEELKRKIKINKEINRQEESLHISLLNKNKVLDNREAFIKGQYERAGIKWE